MSRQVARPTVARSTRKPDIRNKLMFEDFLVCVINSFPLWKTTNFSGGVDSRPQRSSCMKVSR